MTFRAPIGTDDFAQLRREGLVYVDKTSLISDLVQDGARVVLLPRPRRFGKSTNLSMLRYFFEHPPAGEDRADLFEGLAVAQDPAAQAHAQRYTVLAITLKEIKATSPAKFRSDMSSLLAALYAEHRDALDHPSISDFERSTLRAILHRTADQTTLERGLLDLSRMLHRATGRPVVILVDEYDTPILAGWTHGYYAEVVDFFRIFLGSALKGNPSLYKGVLTGVLRIAKESIFSPGSRATMNHLAVYGLLRDRYSTAFGFTEAEVVTLAAQADASHLLPQIRRWYNGYRCGEATLYNPWSVLNFLSSEDFVPRPYWVNTSTNDLVGQLITTGRDEISLDLEQLLTGGKVRKRIDDALVLPDIPHHPEGVWGLLLFSGYLKAVAVDRHGVVTLAIPNREVKQAYEHLLQRWLHAASGGSLEVNSLLQAMLRGEVDAFESRLDTLVLQVLSSFDGRRTPEQVHHAFVLGMLVQLRSTHRVESNPESGHGRADVLVIPRRVGRPGVVLEFKRLRPDETPETAMASALRQIETMRHTTRLEDAGANPVLRYGIVFDGKRVIVRGERSVAHSPQ